MFLLNFLHLTLISLASVSHVTPWFTSTLTLWVDRFFPTHAIRTYEHSEHEIITDEHSEDLDGFVLCSPVGCALADWLITSSIS